MNFLRATLLVCSGLVGFGIPAQAYKMKNPTAVFAGLDKITGRIIAFEAGVDETIQFGSLLLTTRVCYTRFEEHPRTTTFLEVEEVSSDNQYKKIFSGWMFAASPGLNAIDHPVYDVWLTDCKGGTVRIETPPELDEVDDAPPPPPLSVEAKKPPKPALPLPRGASATSGPLRLPDSTAGGPPVPPGSLAPRLPPQQRFFPTNTPSRGGATYDPGPRN